MIANGMKSTVLELGSVAVEARTEREKIVVRLADGREISFPFALNRKLREAEDAQRANIEIICGGTGLHWSDLDEDLSVIGILEGRFGRA